MEAFAPYTKAIRVTMITPIPFNPALDMPSKNAEREARKKDIGNLISDDRIANF